MKGTSNLKLDAIKTHELSKSHRAAALKAKNIALPVSKTPAGKALIAITKLQQERVKLLMRNTHAIVKHARPFTDHIWMSR